MSRWQARTSGQRHRQCRGQCDHRQTGATTSSRQGGIDTPTGNGGSDTFVFAVDETGATTGDALLKLIPFYQAADGARQAARKESKQKCH
jgi:hypothetical protein